MNTKKFGIMLIGLMLVVGLLFATVPAEKVSAATRDVCPSGCTYSTIQAAYAAAASGDTISIAPGEYFIPGNFQLNKNLTIVGSGKDTTIIKASSSLTGYWWTINPGYTINISGVTLDGQGLLYVLIWAKGNATINDNIIKNANIRGYAIYAYPGSTTGITNNIITSGGYDGIYVGGNAAGTAYSTITGNTITGRGTGDVMEFGITVAGNGNATISGNTISNFRAVHTGTDIEDPDKSAAIVVTTKFYDGNEVATANVTGNKLTDSTVGLLVGGTTNDDRSTVTATGNTIEDNDFQVEKNAVSTDTNFDVHATFVSNTFDNSAMVQGGAIIYPSIQQAVDVAAAGNTVLVGPGLYDERVDINKAVTLLGATHGISKKNYVPPTGYVYDTTLESVIQPTNDIDVSVVKIGADGVVVDGFVVANTSILTAGNMKNLVEFTHTFEFPTGSSLINSVIGPLTGPAQNGNLGRFGVVAPGPSSTSATKTRVMIISDNYIYDCLGNGGGVAIIGAMDTGVEINTGMRITDNTITGHHRSGIEIAGMISGTSTNPVLITGNNITNNGGQLPTDATQLKYGNGIAFIRIGSDRTNGEPYGIPQYVNISGNLIEGNEKNGIYLGPIVKNLSIEGNTIQNNGSMTGFQSWDGVRIDLNELYYAAPNPLITSFLDNVLINENNILQNGALGVNVLGGVPDSGDIDATLNWWGSACGPTGGTVNGVSAYVDYSPWWTVLNGPTIGLGEIGSYAFPALSTTPYMQAIIDCAAPGSTLTFESGAYPGGLVVNNPGLKFKLNGVSIRQGSPAFTIYGDDITIQGPGVLDGDGSTDPGIWVKDGADNFALDSVEVRKWANGIQVSGIHDSFKLVSNWIHDNVGAGLLTDVGMEIDVDSITTIEGNLFKENGGPGINHNGTGTLLAEYNSWGDIDGPLVGVGDGISGSVDYTPWTYSEVFVDMVPDTLATQAAVNENGTFSIAVKVDAEKLYAVSYKLTYNTAYLQLLNLVDGTFKGTYGGCMNDTSTDGVVIVTCYRISPDLGVDNALGETISTLTFQAEGTGLMANGPWETYFDLSTDTADLSSAATGGIKVFVNNGGFGAPSSEAGHTITDTDDGRVIISGLANYSGYIDLEGRANDSGATITVYNQATIAGATAYANGTSASSGKYTTVYLGAYQLTVPTEYWFQVDARLYLPTTALEVSPSYPTLPTVFLNRGVLATRSITSLLTVQLLGGDANDNNAVDASDLGCLGGAYGKPAEACGSGSSDVNGDGKVDIYDLVLLGGNYDKTSSPWEQ